MRDYRCAALPTELWEVIASKVPLDDDKDVAFAMGRKWKNFRDAQPILRSCEEGPLADDVLSEHLTQSRQKLNLSWCLTPAQLGTVVEHVAKTTSLEYLDLSFNNLRFLDTHAQAFINNETLKTLKLSGNYIDGEMIARVITENETLENLHLEELKGPTCIGKVAEALQHNTTLKQLYLSGNPVTSQDVVKFPSVVGLDGLHLWNTQLLDKDCKLLLMERLKPNEMTAIELGFNRLTNPTSIYVVESIDKNKIIHLGLARCYIENDDRNVIQGFLKDNTTLQHLDLSRNQLRSMMQTILEALCTCTNLTTLVLGNTGITHDTGTLIADVMENTRLEHLDVSNNYLVYPDNNNSIKRIAEALETNTTLTHLSLSETGLNKWTDDREIAKALYHNTTLKSLDLSSNAEWDFKRYTCVKHIVQVITGLSGLRWKVANGRPSGERKGIIRKFGEVERVVPYSISPAVASKYPILHSEGQLKTIAWDDEPGIHLTWFNNKDRARVIDIRENDYLKYGTSTYFVPDTTKKSSLQILNLKKTLQTPDSIRDLVKQHSCVHLVLDS